MVLLPRQPLPEAKPCERCGGFRLPRPTKNGKTLWICRACAGAMAAAAHRAKRGAHGRLTAEARAEALSPSADGLGPLRDLSWADVIYRAGVPGVE